MVVYTPEIPSPRRDVAPYLGFRPKVRGELDTSYITPSPSVFRYGSPGVFVLRPLRPGRLLGSCYYRQESPRYTSRWSSSRSGRGRGYRPASTGSDCRRHSLRFHASVPLPPPHSVWKTRTPSSSTGRVEDREVEGGSGRTWSRHSTGDLSRPDTCGRGRRGRTARGTQRSRSRRVARAHRGTHGVRFYHPSQSHPRVPWR